MQDRENGTVGTVNLGSEIVSKIVGYDRVDPTSLLANPQNFRMHPEAQRESLDAIRREIGNIAPVIVNTVTGHVIDGHLRVEQDIAHGAMTDVVYVALSVEKERLALATFDPLGALAETDKDILGQLLADVDAPDGPIATLLADLAHREGVDVAAPSLDDLADRYQEPEADTFWPEIRLKVPMDTFRMWQRLTEGVTPKELHVQFQNILIAYDELHS